MAEAIYFCIGQSRGLGEKEIEKRSGFPFPVPVVEGMWERALLLQAQIMT